MAPIHDLYIVRRNLIGCVYFILHTIQPLPSKFIDFNRRAKSIARQQQRGFFEQLQQFLCFSHDNSRILYTIKYITENRHDLIAAKSGRKNQMEYKGNDQKRLLNIMLEFRKISIEAKLLRIENGVQPQTLSMFHEH